MMINALDSLIAQAATLPEPYLIIGPQAAYIYHQWLQPIAKIIDIAIPCENEGLWQATFTVPWLVLTHPPTLMQARQASRLMVLQTPLSAEQYTRRVLHLGLAFMSPEDVCLDLLSTSKTQIGLMEIAALLIKQRANLDWSYLFAQAHAMGVSAHLAQISLLINHEVGRSLLQLPQIETTRHINLMTAIQPNSVRELLCQI